MSVSGFAATAAAVAFFYLGLPDEYLAARVARGGALFLALLGVVLELPLLLYGIARRDVPSQVAV
jgi:Ca2+/H+ antiporter